MSDLFVNTILNHTISLEPKYINNSIDETILDILKNELEGKCIKHGYVSPGSIKILSRSLGNVLTSQFNGSVVYNITLSAEICNPLEDSSIKGKINGINKMGVMAYVGNETSPYISILLAKQHHIENEAFNNLKIGETIKIKVLGKRYEYGDSHISVIGVLDK
jgi:DNA-directed RNA polymerase subunit E'/Rpb7